MLLSMHVQYVYIIIITTNNHRFLFNIIITINYKHQSYILYNIYIYIWSDSDVT